MKSQAPWRAVVLDVEGTTTPMAFVYDVLFPYARARLRPYLEDPTSREALREPLRLLTEEWEAEPQAKRGTAPFPARYAEYVESLMEQDRKSPGLKLLQGQIWEEGYRSGALRGEVFPDVAPALQRWRDAGVSVAIYSSGSELAQRLLFGSTASGDLTPLIDRFFDTRVGAKHAAASYRRIAGELGCPADHLLFVSDVTAELDAAHAAACQVRLCVRLGNRSQPDHNHAVVHGFDELPS